MFYKSYQPRRKRMRHGCLSKLIKLALLALCVYFCLLAFTSGSIGAVFDSLMPGGLPLGYTNVLLMGVDGASQAHSRSDTMIIASVSNSGKVKLTSLMRDTLVSVEGYGARKINSAYAYGGGELAMATVNNSFDLNIACYAAVDFAGFADIIDQMGGVRLSVTKAEMEAINAKKGHKLEKYGENTLLDGVQALRYVRIRKIDSDYQRSNRQRKLLTAILNSLRAIKNPVTLYNTVKSAMPYVKTNMNAVTLGITAVKALLNSASVEQLRIPAEGTYESGVLDGVWSIRADLKQNAKLIREFIYAQ